ncbi:MAG TPA: hypothetical protein VGG60_16295 [Candidatus Binataceae bacterium]|jgi:hypothetical protein
MEELVDAGFDEYIAALKLARNESASGGLDRQDSDIDKWGGGKSCKAREVRIERITPIDCQPGSSGRSSTVASRQTLSTNRNRPMCYRCNEVGREALMTTWDKAALLEDRRAFIEHLQRLNAEGCQWLVVPLAEEESSGSFRCSKCEKPAPDAAPLYSLATHIAFEHEVLWAIEASHSLIEYEDRISRIVEEEPTPMVCGTCCPRAKPHRHDLNHAF